MLIQHNNELGSQLLAEMMENIAEDRTAMHPSVTDLIDCLTKTWYNTEEGAKLDYTDQTKLFFLVGLGLEAALLPARKELATYGEKDGIHYHVDSLDSGLVELKSTRSSVKNVEAEFPPRWMKQVKGYLGAIGQRTMDLAVVYIIPAELKVYHLTFEQMEIDLHWDWLKGRRDVWLKAKADRQAPKAFAYNDGASVNSWECNNCQYKMICDVRARIGM